MARTEITPEMRDFLNELRFASLATIDADGSPQQTVMWYQLRDGVVMMNTKRGRTKDRNLVRDNRASICVEEGYKFVAIEGTIEMIDDQTIAQADIRSLSVKYDGEEAAAAAIANQFGKEERITLLLSIDNVIAHGFDD